MFSTDDTIVAVATPAGRAGLGVVRVAGPQARSIAARLAPGPQLAARVATVRRLRRFSSTAMTSRAARRSIRW